MKDDVFLSGSLARELYENHAQDQPIIDYHNHISPLDISNNRRFSDLYEIWLAPDPYKHRLMRISGIEEYYITGAASPREKFKKFASVFPYLLGNPVYDWSLMELQRVFDISDIPCESNADYIFDKASEMLRGDDYTFNAILGRFNVEYQSPVANIADDLSVYNETVSPSLRGDDLLAPDAELISRIEQKTNRKIHSFSAYMSAISALLDEFSDNGCLFADHSLDDGFVYNPDFSLGERSFEAITNGKSISKDEKNALASLALTSLGGEYSKRSWSLLLHLDARRKTSDRLAKIAGKAGGYAAVGGGFDTSSLCSLLSAMEGASGLPKTVLFPLNMSDIPAMSVLEGSFSEDGVAAKVELGPAWWWCDHALGIKNTLECISSFGVLSEFIGMTTDSRSILSFVRHDYFRRILCSWLAEKYESGCYISHKSTIGEIVEKLSYKNAKRRIDKK